MSDPSAGRDDSQLSPALRRAISANSIGCFVDHARLAGADIERLKAILAEDVCSRRCNRRTVRVSASSYATCRLLPGA